MSRSKATVSSSTTDSLSVPGVTKDSEEVSGSELLTLLNTQDFQFMVCDLENQWLDHPHPSELEVNPISAPSEVVRIVRESLSKEHYLHSNICTETETSGNASKTQSDEIVQREFAEGHRLGDCASPRRLEESHGSASEGSLENRSGKHKASSGSMIWFAVKDGKSSRKPGDRSRSPGGGRGIKKFLKERKALTTAECASCLEELPNRNLLGLRCQHKYCTECFCRLVTTAMLNESSFPPRCCLQEIPAKIIQSKLNREQKEAYKLKVQEYAVSIANRRYCPSATCGLWIPPGKMKNRRETQKCPHCRISICSVCCCQAHSKGEDCPRDYGLDATLQEAELHGWRRCYNCRAMVELTIGCHHITCKCKAQFCYTCGARWRTCACTEADQTRRQVELIQRRTARNGRLEQEENDMAAAITAVERVETQEMEERIQEELRRREEEERRRVEEEESRVREVRRLLSIDERMQVLQDSLSTINQRQEALLRKREKSQVATLLSTESSNKVKFGKGSSMLTEKLQKNLKSQMESLLSSHAKVTEELKAHHQDEENDMIVRLPRLLRGEANQEEREMAIIKRLREAHKKELGRLHEEHKAELTELKQKGSLESSALQAGLIERRRQEQEQEKEELRSLAKSITCDRYWFDKVTEKRKEILEQYRIELVNSGNEVEPLVFVDVEEGVSEASSTDRSLRIRSSQLSHSESHLTP